MILPIPIGNKTTRAALSRTCFFADSLDELAAASDREVVDAMPGMMNIVKECMTAGQMCCFMSCMMMMVIPYVTQASSCYHVALIAAVVLIHGWCPDVQALLQDEPNADAAHV